MSSLADQSQQWFPTSVQVTVHQARNLRAKGKSGTNDAYAIIQLAKDKFSTSVAEKCVGAPVWKEEASFDLPLFHQSNADRCTLHVIVMHRAQVGLDKHLGQAVVNLVDLHDNTARLKTDWFKLVDKGGKEDKARGEVLLDIQFKRNNLSASMFDLSMQDKPRSRISKLKDKVRGKKKDGFSDSASAIVPSVTQVLTDSEGEGDAQSLSQSPGVKKRSKLKTLFAPKSNLQRNVSQSMSTLGTLPEKSDSLSGSRSSGLNAESPEVKKKFKFLGHKRTGSNDSKASQGPFSLLGRSKQSAQNDQNSLCINGSHVYAEEAEPKSGSTLSLNSSGQGSAEDIRRHNSDVSADSLRGLTVPAYREPADRAPAERQHQEEDEDDERRQAEEEEKEKQQRRAEAKRQQEDEERRYQEEQERRKRLKEDEEARRKKLKEEEETRRKRMKEEEETRRKRQREDDDARRRKAREDEEAQRRREEEGRRLEAAEAQRLEEERERLEEEEKRRQEEAQRAEEQKRQDEASMSDRLSSLFGMIRKKEDKREEVLPQQRGTAAREEAPPQPAAAPGVAGGARRSANPFEEIPLSPDAAPPNAAAEDEQQKPVRKPLSAMALLNRTAKVSAVKPRPHPVKPLSSVESQYTGAPPAVREIKTHDFPAGKIKVSDAVESGPYTQLTQEELITMVVKQQTELSKKDAKITELEEYIDNLLVRVIEEQPGILLSLNCGKPA